MTKGEKASIILGISFLVMLVGAIVCGFFQQLSQLEPNEQATEYTCCCECECACECECGCPESP